MHESKEQIEFLDKSHKSFNKFELPADLPDDMGDEDLGEEISLADLGLDVVVTCGDGAQGLAQEAPFDAILVAAATPTVPPKLIEQLRRPGAGLAPAQPVLGPAEAKHQRGEATNRKPHRSV